MRSVLQLSPVAGRPVPPKPPISPPPKAESADWDDVPRDVRPTKVLVAATARATRNLLRRTVVWPRRRNTRSPAWKRTVPEGRRAAGGCAPSAPGQWTLFRPRPCETRAPSGLGRPSGAPEDSDADRERWLRAPPPPWRSRASRLAIKLLTRSAHRRREPTAWRGYLLIAIIVRHFGIGHTTRVVVPVNQPQQSVRGVRFRHKHSGLERVVRHNRLLVH